jgi:hypothetical protein
MNDDLALDTHAISIANYLNQARAADAAAADFRIMAGRELIRAKALIDGGETSLTWTSWCVQHVKRSARDIRRLMAVAGATDPTQARERERARNRAAKPAGSRSVSPFQAHDEGVGAFLRGVSQEACPYTDRQRHAACARAGAKLRAGLAPVRQLRRYRQLMVFVMRRRNCAEHQNDFGQCYRVRIRKGSSTGLLIT